MYHLFYLEVALRQDDDPNIYAFENVSHIPTGKLIEIFEIDLEKDPQIVEGYLLTESSFDKHKLYISQNIGQLNLEIFEYSLRQYVAEDFKEIRKLYKESLME